MTVILLHGDLGPRLSRAIQVADAYQVEHLILQSQPNLLRLLGPFLRQLSSLMSLYYPLGIRVCLPMPDQPYVHRCISVSSCLLALHS